MKDDWKLQKVLPELRPKSELLQEMEFCVLSWKLLYVSFPIGRQKNIENKNTKFIFIYFVQKSENNAKFSELFNYDIYFFSDKIMENMKVKYFYGGKNAL